MYVELHNNVPITLTFLQYMTFNLIKRGLLHRKKPYFIRQKATYQNATANSLIINLLPATSK